MKEHSECRWLFARLDLDDELPPAHVASCPECERRWRAVRAGRKRLERTGLDLSGTGDERLPGPAAWRGVLDAVYASVPETLGRADPGVRSSQLGRALRSVPVPSVPFPTAAEILRAAAEPSPSLERAIEHSLGQPVPTPGWLRARVRAAVGFASPTAPLEPRLRRYARAAAVLLVAGAAGFAGWHSITSEHRNSRTDRGTLPGFEVVYVETDRPFDGSFAFHAALESLGR